MDVPKEHEFHRDLHESRLGKRLDVQSLPLVLDGGLSNKLKQPRILVRNERNDDDDNNNNNNNNNNSNKFHFTFKTDKNP